MSVQPGNRPGRSQRPRRRGFTLLELMIALLVLSILTGLAIPSYQRYLQRGHRAEAVRLLLAAAACQERIRTATGFYDTTRCLDGTDDTGYALSYVPADRSATTEFTLFAEPPTGGSTEDCGTLSLDQSGHRGNSGGASTERACWAGR